MVERRLALAALLLSAMSIAARADWPEDYLADASAAEAPALRQAPQVQRRGSSLTLPAMAGPAAVFVGKHPPKVREADFADYRFEGLAANGQFYVVAASYYEGTNKFWVSRQTGRKFKVYAKPQLSPDGRRAITVNAADAYDLNGIVLWDLGKGVLKERFRHEPTEYAHYYFQGWASADRVKLIKEAPGPDSAAMRCFAVELRLTNGRWQLDEAGERPALPCPTS